MADGGERVRVDDGLLFLGAGAEPLSESRLLLTGHQILDRLSGICEDLLEIKEEIVGDHSRKDEYSQIADVKG